MRDGSGLRLRRGASRSLLLLALAALFLACGPPAAPMAPPHAKVSLLAVGDTGEEPDALGSAAKQQAVADAMAASDRASPVDAVLLLGDNFYPSGLTEGDFLERVRINLVRPYCHFLAFTAAGRSRLEDHCPEPEERRHPVPFLAVLGNHDYKTRDSARLQRERIPTLIANWTMPPGLVQVVDLRGGVTVVLLQSNEIVHGTSSLELAQTLPGTRGPWRILAAHHPIEDPGDSYDRDYAEDVHEALGRGGVPVQLALAGHEHNLQVVAPPEEGAPVQVVVGGGYEPRGVKKTRGRRLFALKSPGFARIDLVEEPEGERLEVTIVAVRHELLSGPRAETVARFAVDRDARVRALPLETAPVSAARDADPAAAPAAARR